MRFSKLLPHLGSASDLTKPDAPTWRLSFLCPLCQHQTSVAVSTRQPIAPVWRISPDPLAMMASIQTGELIEVQWARIWDGVTIEPSMKDLPHPRQANCQAHFTVTNGEITIN